MSDSKRPNKKIDIKKDLPFFTVNEKLYIEALANLRKANFSDFGGTLERKGEAYDRNTFDALVALQYITKKSFNDRSIAFLTKKGVKLARKLGYEPDEANITMSE